MNHIFTTRAQPAVRFKVDDMVIRFSAGELLWCRDCGKRRRAKNMIVYAYYDDRRFHCKKGKGCNRV